MTTRTVQPDGTIDLFPYGRIRVADLTLSQAEETLASQIIERSQARGFRGEGGVKVAVEMVNNRRQDKFLPPYVIEPPDELEVSIKPPPPDWNLSNVTVQQNGVIDLGFLGDVYVAGLTLEEIELKIAQQLTMVAMQQNQKIKQPYRVSVRLYNVQSKYYYVMGSVTTQGRFPIKGDETVLNAILSAGLRSNSLPEKAYLVRPRDAAGEGRVYFIDWTGITENGDVRTNYQVLPGDRIVVPGGPATGLIPTLFGPFHK